MNLPIKIVEAGPRGNKCRKCSQKAKAPSLLLKVTGEFNRFTGHPKTDNYCPNCAKEFLDKAILRLKAMIEILHKGKADESQLGNVRTKEI